MAAPAEPEHETSTKCRNSLKFLPPLMTEMRVVLLGNSWSEQSFVGNLIYKKTSFNPREEPECCVSHSEFIGDKKMVVINTPNVLHPDIPESKVGEFVEDLVKLSDPGPHMFLLILQPESFTEQQQKRLQSALQLYGDDVYNRILLLTPDRSGGIDKPQQHPQYGNLMTECNQRLMLHKNLQRSELFTVMDTIMEKCDGDHVTCNIYVDTKSEMPSSSENLKEDKGVGSNLDVAQEFVSELRIVLLGSTWSQRNSVEKFILDQSVFNTEPLTCTRITSWFRNKRVTVINTPDLLSPTEDKLNKFLKDCAGVSDPGPHVFLLVLKPEEFNEEHKQTLCRILETYNHQSFDQCLILVTPREESSDLRESHMENPTLKEMIRKCRYGHLKMSGISRSELLTRLGQVVKENDGEHLTHEVFEETTSPADHSEQNTGTARLKGVGRGMLNPMSLFSKNSPSEPSELRIVLLGTSEDKKKKLVDFILQSQDFQSKQVKHIGTQKSSKCVASGDWRGKPVTVVNTPDMFSLSEDKIKKEVDCCRELCSPGPNVLLLFVNTSNFSEKNRQKLKTIMKLFGQDSLKHSMVIMTNRNDVSELLKDCEGRHHYLFADNKESLMEKIEKTAKKLIQTSTTEEQQIKPVLNLVLFGRQGAGKTSAAKAILGRKDLRSVSDSPECVQNQGEVCGRWVSLVELTALGGKPPEEVMEESFKCVSLCEPEGVTAFVLVLPVAPLTDEDKRELQTIQNTFSSRVNDFTMILFTVESDPTHPDVVNFVEKSKDIQELRQSCGGRSLIFNIKSNQQVPELLDAVENINQPTNFCSYSAETFMKVQRERVVQEERDNTALRAEVKKLKEAQMCDEEQQISECLRIVLIGKTGCGKSSSGNTILGKKPFKAELKPTSVTKRCQKEVGEVDGRAVAVVDTPGLFDSTLSLDQVNDEMLDCISLLSPGPHVFLVVMQIGRFTPEEKKTLKLLREAFGKNAEQFTIILFTRGDDLERENKSVEDYIREDDSIQKLIDDCGGRYHVFNNTNKNNRDQVRDLIRKADDMLKRNKGNCYTNEMLQEAEAAIKKEMERILQEKKEEIQREKEELKQKHEEEMQEIKRKMEEEREKLQQTEVKLKEMKENINKEQEEKKREQEEREEERRKRERSDEEHRQIFNRELEKFNKQIQSEKEEKKTVSRELEQTREKRRKDKDDFEKERKEWWEKQKKEDEERQQKEQKRLEELEEQYKKEKEMSEKKMEEENIRRENEEKEKKQLEEKLVNVQQQNELKLKEMKEDIDKELEERKREQEKREEEKRKRERSDEELRQSLNRTLETLDKQIQSEKEEKKGVSRELEQTREKSRKDKEDFEKERKEWWEKQRKEDEERKQKEQKRLEEHDEQYKKEKEMYEKKMEEENIRRKNEEKEKKQLKEKLENLQQQNELKLKEMKENINKEQEERKREQEKREEERRKRERSDEEHRQSLNRTLETLDKQIQSEKEEKNKIIKELEQTREKRRKDKEDFEKERKELVEKQKKEDEERQQKEQKQLEKLEEQYKKEKEMYEKKMKEEENIRRENEEKEKKQLEVKLENLQKKFEDEVRKSAEEKNEFQEKYKKKVSDQKEAHKKEVKERDEKYDLLKALKETTEKQKRDNHLSEINKLVKAVSKKRRNLTKFKDLLMKHEKEMKGVKEEEKEKLQKTHESEMSEMIEMFLDEIKESEKRWCKMS